jgi:hypothetical protein
VRQKNQFLSVQFSDRWYQIESLPEWPRAEARGILVPFAGVVFSADSPGAFQITDSQKTSCI